jgi:hypothetical protein
MSSSVNNQVNKPAMNLSGLEIPTDFCLSLAAGPLLLGVISLEAVLSGLKSVGINSEELFRGDRLPLLHFPDADD